MPPGAAEVDAYLAALRPDQRAALSDLRQLLRRLLPDHGEPISYAMPGFRQPGPKGKMVAGYAAFARHLGNLDGQVLVFFVITVAAAEVAVGLAIIVALYRARQTIMTDDLTSLKG